MKHTLKVISVGFFLCFLFQSIHAQCSGALPVYQDLATWFRPVTNGVHYSIRVEVTYVNSPLSDGSHYFSAFGRSLMGIGVGGYGPCSLTTDPAIYIIYSDRTYGHPLNVSGQLVTAQQPFAIDGSSEEWISLDMINNRITVKSITYQNTTVYSNVTRTGNTIIGNNNGNLIILSIFKTTYSGNTQPAFYTIR
jgi:hypothetical protein